MLKIASFDLTGCLDLDISFIYQRSTADLWLLKSQSGLENEKALVYTISRFLKDKNIKLELVTNNLDIILKCLPECLAIPSFLDKNKNREAIQVSSALGINTLAVFFDSKDKAETLELYKEAVFLIKIYQDLLVDIRCSYQSPSLFLNESYPLIGNDLKRVYFNFVPLCLSNKYSVNTDFGRIIETYNKESGFNKRALSEQVLEMGKISLCSSCASKSKCFGFLKTNKNILSEIKDISSDCQNLKNNYVSPADVFLNKEYKISHDILTMSNNNYLYNKVYYDLACLQDFRSFKTFKNNNFIDIVKFNDPVIFVRQEEEKADIITFDDKKKLLSINLKYLGLEIPENRAKLSHDKLLGTGSFSVLSKVKLNNSINLSLQKELDELINNSVLELIHKYGDLSLVSFKGQDIYYNNKRLYGREWKFIPNIGLVANCIINCDITKDEKFYDLIQESQKDKAYHPVFTGFCNEFPELTFDMVLEFISDKISKFIKVYNENC